MLAFEEPVKLNLPTTVELAANATVKLPWACDPTPTAVVYVPSACE